MVRKVRPGHEEILLDGTAQSVRNEVLRDRSERLDNIKSQEEARPQHFVTRNNETELELSLQSRSFVNRVNDQVRKRQKNVERCRLRRRILLFGECLWLKQWSQRYSWERLFRTIVFPLRTLQISHFNKCSTYLRYWCQNKRRSQDWRRLVGRIIHGNVCHFDW